MTILSLSHHWVPGMQGVPVLPTVEADHVLNIDRGDAIRVQHVSAPSHMVPTSTHRATPSPTGAPSTSTRWSGSSGLR